MDILDSLFEEEEEKEVSPKKFKLKKPAE